MCQLQSVYLQPLANSAIYTEICRFKSMVFLEAIVSDGVVLRSLYMYVYAPMLIMPALKHDKRSINTRVAQLIFLLKWVFSDKMLISDSQVIVL